MHADEIDQLAAMLNQTYVDIPELVALGATYGMIGDHWPDAFANPFPLPPFWCCEACPHSRP